MKVKNEIWENQRYSFLGWNSSSLLPTDRNSFSLKDGSEGWGSLIEVSTAFLSKGWSWVSDSSWEPQIHPSTTDEDGD
jgi:hypothetical protein